MMGTKEIKHLFYGLFVLTLILLSLLPGTTQAQSSGWYAELYTNATLGGSPAVTRTDNKIDFDWKGGAPATGVPEDDFSIRWTRTEWFDTGTYRFLARADDGMRFWLGDLLVFDAWYDQQGGWLDRTLYVSPGTYQMKVEYYEHTGSALAFMHWEKVSTGQGWQGQYYNNRKLNGDPVVTRIDSAIDFDWGNNSPADKVPADYFSVRWTQWINFTAGSYRFFTSTDDGVRLWVDGQQLVDAWYGQKLPNTHTGDISLGAGFHEVIVEYFEGGGEAHAHVWWKQLTSTAVSSWKGEYFTNKDLAGGPVLTTDDADINFDWGTGSPVNWITSDNFSIRWTRQLDFTAGYFKFSVQSDDGVKVWLDGGIVIDQWEPMDYELHYVDGIYLSGSHQVVVEYYEQAGSARIHFWIDPSAGSAPAPTATPTPAPAPAVPAPAAPAQVVPKAAGVTVLVDNGDPGFIQGGFTSSWNSAAAGYNNSLLWTKNNDGVRNGYNWARWYPDLSAGQYEVMVYIPANYGTSTHARYWVKHAGSYTLVPVNQSAYADAWVSLGSFYFNGLGDEFVSLADVTYETNQSTVLVYDVVQWVPQ